MRADDAGSDCESCLSIGYWDLQNQHSLPHPPHSLLAWLRSGPVRHLPGWALLARRQFDLDPAGVHPVPVQQHDHGHGVHVNLGLQWWGAAEVAWLLLWRLCVAADEAELD